MPSPGRPAFRAVEGIANALHNRAPISSLMSNLPLLCELLEDDRTKVRFVSPSSRSSSGWSSIGNDCTYSPITMLPLELLRKVFVLCLSGTRYHEPHARRVPLLLMHVCSLWRDATASTPELWCSLYIRPSSRMPKDTDVALYRAWLERAGTLPLAVAVDARCWSSVGIEREQRDSAMRCISSWDVQVCELMAAFTPRCADLYVIYRQGRRKTNAALASLIEHARVTERLALDLEDLKVLSGCEGVTMLPPKLDLRCAVEQVACLRTLGLGWDKVTELRFEPQDYHAFEEMALVQLLEMCPNLVHLTFDKLDSALGTRTKESGSAAAILSSKPPRPPPLATATASFSSPFSSSSSTTTPASTPSAEPFLVHTSLRSLHVNVHNFVKIAVGLMHPDPGIALPNLRLLTVTVHEPHAGVLDPKGVQYVLSTFVEFLRRSGCTHAVDVVFTARAVCLATSDGGGVESEAYRVHVASDSKLVSASGTALRGHRRGDSVSITRMGMDELSEEAQHLSRLSLRPMIKMRKFSICEFKSQTRYDRKRASTSICTGEEGVTAAAKAVGKQRVKTA
ncbi:hypothetical protein CONPUDRAFT_83884 [Coniophora puteana RWD-64-598 SS2]|uniref:F-box domain-containing protein n=1 Tax=Coniophora puteana (strain RWD-64-598) TaxID=741705 RepID=A0A5M3MI93_CONPW|nr:uncharacterized protein CONPUDRAFT_83884 [Coniophora puteana RWD-64-598 SS2]EIW78504.1 hypothetical protein CONPUDRAFT_83884 [Coniophora puteana RWD-64-598 SS2]